MGLSHRTGGAGFSLIEVLISAVIFLFIVLGIVPFFTFAQRSNRTGAESTEMANLARSRIEEFFQLPFTSPTMTITAGVERTFDEYYSQADEIWKAGTPPVGDPAIWQRTTRIRQFGINALDDGLLDVAEALPDAALPEQVHIKEVMVLVESVRQGSLFGPAQRLTLTTIKSQ